MQSFFDIFYRSATLTRQRRVRRRRHVRHVYEQCYSDICLAQKIWDGKEDFILKKISACDGKKSNNMEDSFDNFESIFKK